MSRAGAILVLGAALLGGCDGTPRAPALSEDPVFQSDREGIRFLAPEGWQQSVRGDVGPGKVERERMLVDYRPRTAEEAAASLRVSLADLPASTDLAALLAGPSHSVKAWTPTAQPEKTPVGSLSGTRYAFSGRVGKSKLAKEVVAVRRGGRVYFFTALYGPKDADVRDQLRRVVGSVIWK